MGLVFFFGIVSPQVLK